MSELYSVSISAATRQEITGGRVGSFIIKDPGIGGPYFIGDSAVDNSNGFALTTVNIYVTSPDVIYVYAVSAGSVKIFHNR